MPDTMINMDYRHVDNLNVDQLELDDLVEIEGEVVKIVAISPMRFGYAITFENEFGEKDIIDFDDYAKFKLFILE